MEYKKIEKNNYNVHLIKTDKFKTIDIRLFFYNDFEKKNITNCNFLLNMLTYSTKKYNSKRLLNIACQELYSLYLSSSNFRLGNYFISKLGISFLNPKYTENSIIEDSVDLLSEILFNPNTLNNKFDSESFNIIKKELESEIETIKEDPRVYSNIRLLENMDDKPYRYHGYCYKEDLYAINEENLYEFYQKFINNSKIEIFVIGDFEFDYMEKLIDNKLIFNNKSALKNDLYIYHDKLPLRIKKVREEADLTQSKLAISLKIKKNNEFFTKYVSNMYTLLLGGISDSLLMKNVREKNSLCYYIVSYLNKADNLIIINSFIAAKYYDKVLKEIKKTLDDIKNGKFTDSDLKKCQMDYIDSLDEIYLNPGSVVDFYFGKELFNNDDINTRKEQIMKVTKNDIIEFAKDVYMDTVYLYGGK